MREDYTAYLFDCFCVSKINSVLELDLEEGAARLPKAVHKKIAEKHAEDYEICMRHMRLVLESPTYIGQHPKHTDKVELIRRVEGGKYIVLVAVALNKNKQGNYNIASAYTVSEDDISKWRQSGRLNGVQK